MNAPLKIRYHRELPKEYKLNQISPLQKNHNKFHIVLSITYHSNTLSNGTLIDINSKFFSMKN